MLLLHLCLEHLSLKLGQLVVVEEAVEVLVADAEYTEQGSFVLWLYLFLQAVEQRLNREHDRSLSAEHHVDQVDESLSRTLNAHLHLLEVHEERSQH